MKSIVVYYSRSGNTKKVADRIRKRFLSDELVIEPKEKYGNYVSALIRMEMEVIKDKSVEFKNPNYDFSDYDVVFLGFPVWGKEMPDFMQNYISVCDFSGKTVIPFATAGTNGREKALKSVEKIVETCDSELYFYTNLLSKGNVDEWLDRVERKIMQ